MAWSFNICSEFDCNQEYAAKYGAKCGGDFTKEPCLFLGEHKELNMSGGSNTDSYVVIFVEVNQSYATSGLGHFGFETKEEAEEWVKKELSSGHSYQGPYKIIGFEDLK